MPRKWFNNETEMKIEFTEHKCETSFYLTPETPAEAAQLLRFTKSTKREIPHISFTFHGDDPECMVSFNKIQPEKQNNYINNAKGDKPK